MGKQKSVSTTGAFLPELFRFGLYKRTQGRITRQVTFAAIAVATALGAWRMYDSAFVGGIVEYFYAPATDQLLTGLNYFVPGLVLVAGIWLAYRVVNYSRFADFLIAVEAEMNKVSWPSRTELIRSSIVVIVVIFALAAILYGFDNLWGVFFRFIGVLKSSS